MQMENWRRLVARSGVAKLVAKAIWPCGKRTAIQGGPLKNAAIMVPPFSGGQAYRSGRYESDVVALLWDVLPLVGCSAFYDLGAHVGYFSLVADRGCGGKAKIHAFEPTAGAFTCLARNLGTLCTGRFEVHNFAVSNLTGRASFVGEDGQVGSGLADGRPDHYASRRFREVRTTTLDHSVFARGMEPPSVIKMDVEGAEYHVLLGAARVLREHAPLWIVESHTTELHTKVTGHLSDFGYRCFDLALNPPGVRTLALSGDDLAACSDLIEHYCESGALVSCGTQLR